jgi:hypothetical protein
MFETGIIMLEKRDYHVLRDYHVCSGECHVCSWECHVCSGDYHVCNGECYVVAGIIMFRAGNVMFVAGIIMFQAGNVMFQAGNVMFQAGIIMFETGNIMFETALCRMNEPRDSSTVPTLDAELKGNEHSVVSINRSRLDFVDLDYILYRDAPISISSCVSAKRPNSILEGANKS